MTSSLLRGTIVKVVTRVLAVKVGFGKCLAGAGEAYCTCTLKESTAGFVLRKNSVFYALHDCDVDWHWSWKIGTDLSLSLTVMLEIGILRTRKLWILGKQNFGNVVNVTLLVVQPFERFLDVCR